MEEGGDAITGSPPHMRGKGDDTVDGDGLAGITPAHAGKSLVTGSGISPDRDHPRTCGEK